MQLPVVDIDQNSIYHLKNWLFSFTENFFSYSYDITYYVYENHMYAESLRIRNKKY